MIGSFRVFASPVAAPLSAILCPLDLEFGRLLKFPYASAIVNATVACGIWHKIVKVVPRLLVRGAAVCPRPATCQTFTAK